MKREVLRWSFPTSPTGHRASLDLNTGTLTCECGMSIGPYPHETDEELIQCIGNARSEHVKHVDLAAVAEFAAVRPNDREPRRVSLADVDDADRALGDFEPDNRPRRGRR